MDAYLEWLLDLTPWHWFALMVALIGVEVAVSTAYLLFAALGALVSGVVLLADPGLDWRLQMLVFAVVTVAGTLFGRKHVRRWASGGAPDGVVNERGRSFTGRRFTLELDLTGGQGRVHVGDTWWQAASETGEALPAGTIVEVTGMDSTTLKVRRVDQA